ncbi:MAG: hypothetical protein OHK0012_16130 [Synechococcales cyanobacterium]
MLLLSDLNDAEQYIYLKCLAAVAQVDTVFDDEEINLFMVVAGSLGLSQERSRQILEEVPLLPQEVPVMRPAVAEVILKDMVAIATCNHELLPSEIQLIGQMASAMGVSSQQVNHCLQSGRHRFFALTSDFLPS